MEQAGNIVSRIEEKVLELLDRHRKLKHECADLRTRNAELLELIESQKNEIAVFKEQIVKLKITKSLTTSKGSIEVKAKIDELLREIDKCVGLLDQ